MEKLISIIVPVYMVEEFLPKCIDSIINQTYKNIEIILVDDGSEDNCPILCDEYAAKDERIIVIHQENVGLSGARNKGLEIAKGEYVCFVDSDDYIDEEFIESLYDAIKKTNSDISMCFYYDVYKEVEKKYFPPSKRIIVFNNIKIMKKMTKVQYIVTWNKMYKTSLFNDVRFPLGKIHEDVFTTYKLMFNSKRICVLKKQLYGYRFNEKGIAHADYNLRHLQELEGIQSAINFFERKKEASIFIKFYLSQAIFHLNELNKNRDKYKEEITSIISKTDFFVSSDYLNFIDRKKYAFFVKHTKVYLFFINQRNFFIRIYKYMMRFIFN